MANRFFQKMKQDNPELPDRIGVHWSHEEETQLLQLLREGKPHEEIGDILERTSGGIKSRVNHIARNMYDAGNSVESIINVTKLTREALDSVIQKHNSNKVKRVKALEDKVLTKEPVQAKLITIPQSDIMELKLVMFEIRDLLKEFVEKEKRD